MATVTRFGIEPVFACLSCMRQVSSLEVWQQQTDRGLVFTHHTAGGHPVVRIEFREQQELSPPASDEDRPSRAIASRTCPACGSLDPAFRRLGVVIGDEEGCTDAWHAAPNAAQAQPASDPPGLVKCRKFAAENPRTAREIGLSDLLDAAYPLPASPQAEDADDMQCCDSCGASRSCECGQPPASPQAETKGDE